MLFGLSLSCRLHSKTFSFSLLLFPSLFSLFILWSLAYFCYPKIPLSSELKHYSKPLANYCAISLNAIANLTVLCYEDLCLKIAKDFKILTKVLDEIKELKREERLDRLTSIYLKIVEDHSPRTILMQS
jgi:hypothetical protein